MIRVGLAVLAGSLAVLPAAASDDARYGTEYQRCSNGSTPEIERCIGRLTQEWDRRLNAAYHNLMRDNPHAESLRDAQRRWIAFRDANCRYYATGEGTITRLQYAECMRSMTAHRALELEELKQGN